MKHIHPRLSIFLCMACSLLVHSLCANNIQLTNITLTANNEAVQSIRVRFDLSWENSWRTSSAPKNWDAAWVFVKYKHFTTGAWHHARLHGNTGHTAPAGSTIATGLLTPGSAFNATTNWGVGVFQYRSANGTGTTVANGTELQWNYGENGITYADIAEVQVFAIEMVHVPQESYFLGDAGDDTEYSFYMVPSLPFAPVTPYQVTSESAITVGTSINNLHYGGAGDQIGPIPSAFPKGHAGFYLMKHEIAQKDYVDFLNTLTRVQQDTRTATPLAEGVTIANPPCVLFQGAVPGGIPSTECEFRNGVRCDVTINASGPITFYCDLNGNSIGNEPTDGQWIACNNLSRSDVLAYLDWCGLRPMTELEFEKACRGPVFPVPNEFAWGTTDIINSTSISNSGSINEANLTAGANVCCGNMQPNGPIRVGAFASVTSNRVQSGASYYGVLDMSGNLGERVIGVGTPVQRTFNGVHGNGSVNTLGDANVANWDPVSLGGRDGGLQLGPSYKRISDRTLAAGGPVSGGGSDRFIVSGGRGLRAIP